MTRIRKKLMKLIFGLLIGIFITQISYTNRNGYNSQYTSDNECRLLNNFNNNNNNDNNNKNIDKLGYKNGDIFNINNGNVNSKKLSGDNKESGRNKSKNLVLVGVMTAAQYLDSRAKAVLDTWGSSVPGRIIFYSSEDSHSNEIPLVALPDVDDSYPPQKKSFRMLKHMHDHFADDFEWFVRADDDVFVRTDRLEELLRSIDSRRPWFVGQTGRGNSEEFGTLALDGDENFCMGGPGVIMSRTTLKRVAPFAEDCLRNLYTGHEDVELGRCVRKYAGVSCTWSYEMQVILYHNQSGQAAFSGDLKQKEVHRAITLHPVKQPKYMYRLDKYFMALKIQNYQHESVTLHRDIAETMTHLGYRRRGDLRHVNLVEGLPLFPSDSNARADGGLPSYLGDTRLLGAPLSLTRHKPKNASEVLDWELISKTLYSYRDINPRRRIGSSLKEGLNDVVRDIMEVINSYSKQRGRVIDFKEILYGYWRLDPVHGVDLILDLLLVYRKYRGHKMTVQVRRHAYIQQSFTGIVIREVDNGDTAKSPVTEVVPVHRQIGKIFSSIGEALMFSENARESHNVPTINFILPLSGRHETFKRFLKVYEEVCLKPKEMTRLLVVLYDNGDFDKNEQLIVDTNTRYTDRQIFVLYKHNETFSRARALEHGVKKLTSDELMLFIDVDMVFDSKSLQRIRKNTVEGRSVYFPIVYSLYNPHLLSKNYTRSDLANDFIINEERGFWRQFGFGIVSLYKRDYSALGGFNLLISGWGFEDVNFYDNVVKSPTLRIVRGTDPGLIHIYHSIDCDVNLDETQKTMCLGTQANILGSVGNLQRIYKKYEPYFR